MKFSLRLLYLYLFSFVGLIIIVISTIRLVNLGLTVTVFKDADRYITYPQMMSKENDIDVESLRVSAELDQKRSRQRDLSNTLAMLVVGVPLYAYHWGLIKKEAKK